MVAPFIVALGHAGATSVQTGGGTDSVIGTMTIVNGAASAKTNEVVTFGIPIHETALGASQYWRVYDDNGSGAKGTVLANFQMDHSSTDANSKVRWARFTGIVPSLGSSATRKLFVESSTTAVPTGTAITTTDLLATSFRVLVTIVEGGTTYTVDSDDLLAAGTTFSSTTAQCVTAATGPAGSEFYCSSPPFNGASAHASGNGLRVYMCIRAFKADTGAVSGGNPITSTITDVWVLNEDAARATASHYYYSYKIERSTSLSDGTLISTDDTDADANPIRYSYATTQPAATLTATGGTSTGAKSWTRSTGVWDTDIIGAHIGDGTGYAVVTARTNDTTIAVYVYTALSGTSFTSGNWTQYGIGHHYAVTMPPRQVFVGTKPTNIPIWGDNTITTGAPTTRAPLAWWATSKLGLNWQQTFASASFDMTSMDAMAASDGTRRPLTFLGGEGSWMGTVETDIGKSGWENTIGPVPVWCVNAFAKYNADARRCLFENAEYWSTWQWLQPLRMTGSPSAGNLGCVPRNDGGAKYNWNPAFSGTLMATPATTWWPYDGDAAHHSQSCYPAWLMSGRLYFLIQLQKQEGYTCWSSADSNLAGSENISPNGPIDLSATYPNGYSQTRALAWRCRDQAMTTISTPDGLDAKIANPKSYYLAKMADTVETGYQYNANDVLGVYTGATNAPQFYGVNEDRNIAYPVLTSGWFNEWWQVEFGGLTAGMIREFGLLTGNGGAWLEFFANGTGERYTATGIVPDIIVPSYGTFLKDSAVFTTWPAGWDVTYQRSCWVSPIDTAGDLSVYFQRTPTGTLTLSAATTGAGRTFTFSNSYFTSGGTGAGGWYVNGYIRDTSGGYGKITSVTSATVVVVEILSDFGSTTPTISNIRIPGPHPSDYANEFETVSGDYPQFYVAAGRVAVDAGYNTTDVNSAITWMTGRTGYSEVRPNFWIATR